MSATPWHLLVVGDPAGRQRSLATAAELDPAPLSTVVAEPGDASPWSPIGDGLVVILRTGDEIVGEAHASRLEATSATPTAATVGGHRTRGARWEEHPAPDRSVLDPARLLLHCPAALSTVAVPRSLLPDVAEVAPDRPGGDRWLLAHLAQTASVSSVPLSVATVLTRTDDADTVAAAAAVASTYLAHELGVAAAARDQLMELTWLIAEGSTDGPPDGWWSPIVERADPAELDQLCRDLHRTLAHLSGRLRSAVGGIEAIVEEHGTPSPPYMSDKIGDVENARLEIERLRHELERRDGSVS